MKMHPRTRKEIKKQDMQHNDEEIRQISKEENQKKGRKLENELKKE